MTHRKPRWLRRILLTGIGLFLLVQLWFLAWVLIWKVTEPGPTQFMKIRLAELQKKLLVDNPMRLYWPDEI